MHPGATLFLDVCVQPDLWPGGAWPIVTSEQAHNVARLFALATDLAVRQGGVVCRHTGGTEGAVPTSAAHCGHAEASRERPQGCAPVLPMRIGTTVRRDDEDATLDRTYALYVDSGCGGSPDEGPERGRAFAHLTAGVRDAVVFGAGVEYGLDLAVAALLRRRIRVHVALDAAGAADDVAAQLVVAAWKRRGVDGATVDTIGRMLQRD